jgi:hypothetical protein
LALGSFLDGLDLLFHGSHVDTRALSNGQEFEEDLDNMRAAMEAMHGKKTARSLASQGIRVTVSLTILRSREWSSINGSSSIRAPQQFLPRHR